MAFSDPMSWLLAIKAVDARVPPRPPPPLGSSIVVRGTWARPVGVDPGGFLKLVLLVGSSVGPTWGRF